MALGVIAIPYLQLVWPNYTVIGTIIMNSTKKSKELRNGMNEEEYGIQDLRLVNQRQRRNIRLVM